MRTHNIFFFFFEKYEKYYIDTPSYMELCRITRKPDLGLETAGLHSGVVLFSSGLYSRFLLSSLT